MLLKVKPDGPVYEVQFTSQLVGASVNTAAHGASRTSVSSIIGTASVTSVTCNTRPLVSSLPSVTNGQAAAAAGPDASRRMNSSSGTVRTRVSPLAFHHWQPHRDARLNCNAAARTTAAARCTSDRLANTEILENLVTAGNTVHLDAADATGCK